MPLEKKSHCKVNLLLNVLGKRADGFHELETVMQPVNFCDELTFERNSGGVELLCSDAALPVDSRNLVFRAAKNFLDAANVSGGVKIHLEKKIPLAAGLGGGSGNAAATLLALNELFDQPLATEKLFEIAATLGSDIPFFLQNKPALATGRGEKIQPLENFPALRGKAFLLIHPGFGISTAWAYQNLARFPAALNGEKGRARELISRLQANDLPASAGGLYNSLEAPALEKFPILELFQDFLRANGAVATLMSGSGSTTFAIAENISAAEMLAEKFKSKFGSNCWMAVVPV
ncbi:MAG TPA: 4-(cytidine 5'-diphospho)-2-C-methyl-D-erythritol kinase [Candidatus Dormibacteraeota bacterium]|jgi:4-diphosphocytidyl-2-C-methyl-D-erythritol kinase|nr:4-(cytidine 5'-diphospho)-2-C-methyl-D-erythritol kinase [Candidatus Dormibacteraeota bacterium]